MEHLTDFSVDLEPAQALPTPFGTRMTFPRFETGDERHAWLNQVVALAYNELSKDHIDYRIYQVR